MKVKLGLEDRQQASSDTRMALERPARAGDSPVWEIELRWVGILSTAGHGKSCRKLGRPLPKAKYT
jgi:hypothetical protein